MSARADYAVRACLELALHPDGWTTADEVAQAQGIPSAFLQQVLKELRAVGVVEAKRGTEGGHRLARSPADITVADVIRAVDGPLTTVAGTLVEDVVYEGAAAPLRDTWVALRCAIRSVLVGVTLADLRDATMPSVVTELLSGPDSWHTDPEVRRRYEARASDLGHTS